MSLFRLAKTFQSSSTAFSSRSSLRRSTTTQKIYGAGSLAALIPSSRSTARPNLPPLSWHTSTTRTNKFQTRLYSSTDTNAPTRSITEGTAFTEEDIQEEELVDHSSTSRSTSTAYSLLLEDLNPSQVEAVTQATSSVSRVVAGPGSGKTRVLTCRIAYLLQEDRHGRVLAVTFTRKAAGEMQKRVETLLQQQQEAASDDGDHEQRLAATTYDQDGIVQETVGNVPKGLERVTLGTFHSVCAKVLRYNGNLLASLPSIVQDMAGVTNAVVNLDGSFAIADQSDQLRILKEALEAAEIDLKKSAVKPQQILMSIGQIKEALSQGQDPFKSGEKGKPIPKTLRIAKEIYGLYREKLLTNNAVDFDDLIFMTRELLMEHRDLRERLHERWPHVLVDEFQDTSRSQMDLVKLLTSKSLFVVGDADQSIYSWRGAHVGSLSDFATEFKGFSGGGVATVYLKENYR
jgi:DNA helicase-2/ATP-dependent DNA helicase PcrA